MKRNEDSQSSDDEARTIRMIPGAVLEQVLGNLFRIDDDDILSQESRMHYVACMDLSR